MLGNERLRVLPVWELEFGNLAQGARPHRHREGQARPRLPGAPRHRARAGQGPLAASCARASRRLAKRICRTLELDGYARIDFRLSADGVPYFIEANPNPEIAQIEEFAAAARHDGLEYTELLHRIVALGIARAGALGVER